MNDNDTTQKIESPGNTVFANLLLIGSGFIGGLIVMGALVWALTETNSI